MPQYIAQDEGEASFGTHADEVTLLDATEETDEASVATELVRADVTDDALLTAEEALDEAEEALEEAKEATEEAPEDPLAAADEAAAEEAVEDPATTAEDEVLRIP